MSRIRYYLPSAILVGLFVGLPSLVVFVFAGTTVTSRTLTEPWHPTLHNFAAVFTTTSVRQSLLRTVEIALLAVGVELVIGTALALAMMEWRTPRVVDRLMAIPVFASPLAIGILWKLLFTENGGMANALVGYFDLGPIPWLSVASPFATVNELNGIMRALNVSPATCIVVLADVWQWTPFVTLVVAARLSAVPCSIRDAALIDGLSRPRFIVSVLLPLLRPMLVVVGCVRLVDAMKIFDTVWVLFGNSVATATASVTIVEYGLVVRDFGRAAAISVVLLLLSSTLVALVLRQVGGERR